MTTTRRVPAALALVGLLGALPLLAAPSSPEVQAAVAYEDGPVAVPASSWSASSWSTAGRRA